MDRGKPVSIMPCLYPYYQMDEIESIVNELLENCVICLSQDTYLSPVLLVHKADGSWHMYRLPST